MKKRNLLYFIFSLLCIYFVGCGKETNDTQLDKKTIEEGVLMVGCHIGYAPMEYYDEDGKTVIGFDVELAQLIADELGLELKLVPCAWDAIFNNLENKSFDMIISGVSYTEERKEKHSLTKSYLTNGLVMVVKADSSVKTLEDLQNKGVGVQLETTADYFVREYKKNGFSIGLSQYENVVNAFEALERGDVESVLADSVVANYYLVDKEGYNVVWESEDVEPFCICLAKENVALRDEINDILDEVSKQGKIKKLSEKYFGVDLTMR